MAQSSSSKATSMAELMAKVGSNVTPLQKGELVTGTIKKLTPKEILMDIGAKGDALVLEYDRKNLENLLSLLHVGETVTASVISPESEQGFPVVSLRRTLDDLIYSKFEKAYKENQVFSVRVQESTRGGYFVQSSFGVQGFLPNSQITTEGDLSGKTLDLKVIEFDRSKKRVIFSEKAVSYVTDITEIESFVKKGETVTGEITSINPYGIYVLITPKAGVKIEGFIHISELSHDRIENISNSFKKGSPITVQILHIDPENRRVNLSLKALQKDAFEEVKNTLKVEQKVTGTVTDVKSRGVTLSLVDGITGFIPATKIPAGTTYEVGQSVDTEVTDFDSRRRVVVVSPVLKKTFVGYR